MPISDISLPEAKALFDLNVWSIIEVTQAFLPLLLASKGMIVNQISTAALLPLGFQSTYNASKTAASMFSDCMKLELAPFGIQVIDLKTSSASSNNFANQAMQNKARLPKESIYQIAGAEVEKTLSGERFEVKVTAEEWAQKVTKQLLSSSPKSRIWAGSGSWIIWFASLQPFALPEFVLKKMVGLDLVEKAVMSIS